MKQGVGLFLKVYGLFLIPETSEPEAFGGRSKHGVVGRRDRVDRELAYAPPSGRRVGVLLEVRHPEPRQETQGKEVSGVSSSNVHSHV